MAEYSHNHIVPRGYLRQFAESGVIACTFVRGEASKDISIVDAAVRSNFYVHRRPDGTRDTEVEKAFGVLEEKAVHLIRKIDDRWPLCDDDHAVLTEFVALQFVRSPGWRVFHDATRDKVLSDAVGLGLPQDVLEQHVVDVSSDRYRSNLMLRQIPLVGTLFGGMHFQLVRFGDNRLITSDHPVVCLPFGGRPQQGRVPSIGLRNIAEVRLALTPSRAVILTWLDEPSDLRPARGFPALARQLNHAVRLQAESQWFSRPGPKPCVYDDCVRRIGPIIHPAAGALDGSSQRWQQATAAAQRMADHQGARQEMSIVRIRRAA